MSESTLIPTLVLVEITRTFVILSLQLKFLGFRESLVLCCSVMILVPPPKKGSTICRQKIIPTNGKTCMSSMHDGKSSLPTEKFSKIFNFQNAFMDDLNLWGYSI